MDWRQTGDVGKVQLRQWHRALAAIAKVNSLQPIKEFTEQMAQLFNGALAAQIDDPFVLNIGMNERFGPDHLLHFWAVQQHSFELTAQEAKRSDLHYRHHPTKTQLAVAPRKKKP